MSSDNQFNSDDEEKVVIDFKSNKRKWQSIANSINYENNVEEKEVENNVEEKEVENNVEEKETIQLPIISKQNSTSTDKDISEQPSVVEETQPVIPKVKAKSKAKSQPIIPKVKAKAKAKPEPSVVEETQSVIPIPKAKTKAKAKTKSEASVVEETQPVIPKAKAKAKSEPSSVSLIPKVKAKAKSKPKQPSDVEEIEIEPPILKISTVSKSQPNNEETQNDNAFHFPDVEASDENELLIEKGYEKVKQKLVEINTEIDKTMTDRIDVLEDKTKNLNKMYDDMKANYNSNKNLNINNILNEIKNEISDIRTEVKGSVHNRISNLENKRDEMTQLIDKLLQLYNKMSLKETNMISASSSSIKAKTHIDYDSEVED